MWWWDVQLSLGGGRGFQQSGCPRSEGLVTHGSEAERMQSCRAEVTGWQAFSLKCQTDFEANWTSFQPSEGKGHKDTGTQDKQTLLASQPK